MISVSKINSAISQNLANLLLNFIMQIQVIVMLRRELMIFFSGSFLILASVPDALCRSSPPIIYVAGDGSGD